MHNYLSNWKAYFYLRGEGEEEEPWPRWKPGCVERLEARPADGSSFPFSVLHFEELERESSGTELGAYLGRQELKITLRYLNCFISLPLFLNDFQS